MEAYELRKKKKKVAQLCPTLCNPMVCSLPGSSVHGNSPGKNTGMGSFHSSGDLSDPGIETGPPALQADSLWVEPPKGSDFFAKGN